MKKLFSALILCTAILCGCSAKGGEEISETSAPETSSVTVTETESATMTTTTKETTVTKPAEEKIILTPIPSNEPFEVMGCKIIEDIAVDNEEDFPDKEVIKRAREICFADEEIQRIITEDNDYQEEYSEHFAVIRKIETAEDIPFICGVEYDFDGDCDYEYVISLDYVPSHNVFDGAFVIYIDGDKYEILENIGNNLSAEDICIITGGNYAYKFLELKTSAGGLWYSEDIYSFESGMPEKVTFDCGEANSIRLKNNIFYCEIKRNGTYPFVLCGDGKFRQLGREKITREDFEAHVRNGGRYIDSLSENGEEITDIYTYGYYNYELYGEGFCYDVYGKYIINAFLTERHDCDGVHGELYFTDEAVYGDVWAVQTTTRSRNYDIGGGYVCYKTGKGENEILYVAKDNIITDSINLNDMSFDPDWQINFYDMDTSPCFALEVGSFVSVNDQPYFIGSIDYRTYFIIDGKITEMNWTLDGERLDTIDYTMLKCRGEGDEFVSYSIPHWDERYTKRHFAFADGDYTNIVGYTEYIDNKIMKPDDDSIRYALQNLAQDKNSEAAYEVMSKFFDFWSSAYNAYGSVTDDDKLRLRLEKEGFRTKEEMLNTLSEFCTSTAAKEVYSKLVESRYSDFKVIDDRIYLYDGAPSTYLPDYFIESAEEKDGVITARFFAYYAVQDIPHVICPPLYAEFVREDGVWKISSLPKEK